MKNDYNPSQKEGLNRFSWRGEDVLIVHPGAYIHQVTEGQVVLFRRYDGLVWCGRTYRDSYTFELEKPVPVTEALQWLSYQNQMVISNPDDFSGQEELPF